MKRLSTLLLAVALGGLTASPVGQFARPTLPRDFDQKLDQMRICVGYRGDLSYDCKLKPYRRFQRPEGSARLERTLHALDTTVRVCDFVDIVARLGISAHRFNSHNAITDETSKTKSKGKLAYGAGLRAICVRAGNTALGVHGFYHQDQSVLSKSKYYQGRNLVAEERGLKSLNIKYVEKTWAGGLTLSHEFPGVTPYIGVQYVKNSFKPKNYRGANYTPLKWKNRKPIGGYIGATMINEDTISLNLEGRFINEFALSASAQYLF